MVFRLSPGLCTAICDALYNGVGTNIDSWILEFRTGAQPATANLAPTGSVVSAITLPADAMGAAAAGAVAKAGTWQDASADANGTTGWARLRAAGDLGTTNNTDKRYDFAVTATGGGGDITLDNVVIAIGQVVTMSTFGVTQPAQ